MTPIEGVAVGSIEHVTACAAAGNHERAKSNRALWESLPLVGRTEGPRGRYLIEVRNCVCTTSLAVKLPGSAQ